IHNEILSCPQFESQDVLVPWHRPQHLSTPSLELTSTTTTTSEEDGPPPYHAYTQTSDSDSCRSARYVDSTANVQERFIGFTNVSSDKIAAALFQHVEGVIAEYNVGNSLIAQTYDGASVMAGNINGLKTKVQEKPGAGQRKRGRSRHKGQSIDLRDLQQLQSSSSLSSPNETCYSFVRQALQKLAGGKRGGSGHRPGSWTRGARAPEPPPPHRYDPEGCEDGEGDGEDIQDLPIELRRLEEEQHDPPQRHDAAVILNHKSKSLSDILTVGQRTMVRSRSSVPSLGLATEPCAAPARRPDARDAGARLPSPSWSSRRSRCARRTPRRRGHAGPGEGAAGVQGVRARAAPRLRVQAELHERGAHVGRSACERRSACARTSRSRRRSTRSSSTGGTARWTRCDTFFSTSTAKRLQLLKNKLKSSTTGIEKVAGTSFKNGFVRILQGWKGGGPPPAPAPSPRRRRRPCTPPRTARSLPTTTSTITRRTPWRAARGERRHSREDGSDSSKDSSLQSDTSVDSEDSFASVILCQKTPPRGILTAQVPAAHLAQGEAALAPAPPPGRPSRRRRLWRRKKRRRRPRARRGPEAAARGGGAPRRPSRGTASACARYRSCCAQGRGPSRAGYQILDRVRSVIIGPYFFGDGNERAVTVNGERYRQKLQTFRGALNRDDMWFQQDEATAHTARDTLLLLRNFFPGRIRSVLRGRRYATRSLWCGALPRWCWSALEPLARPLPRLLSLELFNPETDDMDSDSSGVSSPDSVSSVISVLTEEPPQLTSTATATTTTTTVTTQQGTLASTAMTARRHITCLSPGLACLGYLPSHSQLKLAGGKRGGSGHRPWFLDSWSSCTKEPPPPHRYDPEGCEDGEGDGEDIQDLPIELRRLEEEQHDPPQRHDAAVILNHKSKSLSDILTVGQRTMVRSRSSVPSLGLATEPCAAPAPAAPTPATPAPASKPKLVKQKKSLCEEDAEEEGDMRDLVKALPEFKVSGPARRHGSVFKQSSMNEELMSAERLREKERVRQNIQKQASLNEELIYRRHRTLDSLRDTFFSTSTAKRLQLLKNKLKSSTTGIEKVAGTSFKNGFVRILQGWKGGEASPGARPVPETPAPPCTPPPDSKKPSNNHFDNNKKDAVAGRAGGERRHSREDGSDSSKDSSLQSDTSVDSEDSFASVIFVPKPDPAAGASSPPKSPQPTSPKTPLEEEEEEAEAEGKEEDQKLPPEEAEPPAAESRHSERLRQIQELLRSRAGPVTGRISGLFSGGAAVRNAFPLVRRSSAMVLGRPEPLARPLPRLLSLELFNPETDDMDSDSSGVSSPDSVSSVISVLTEEPPQLTSTATATTTTTTVTTQQGTLELPAEEATTPVQPLCSPSSLPPPTPASTSTTTSPKAPEIVTERLLLEVQEAVEEKTGSSESLTTEQPPRVSPSSLSLLEAAADVASSLEDAVDAVIQSSPRARRRKLQLLENNDPMAVLQGGCFSGSSSSSSSWSGGDKLYPGYDSDWSLHKPATTTTSPVVDPRNNNYPWSVGHSPGESRKLSPRYDEYVPEESEPQVRQANLQRKIKPMNASTRQEETWDENCRQHLADFAEKLSEKLLEEIDQYRKQTCQQSSRHNKILAGLERHLDDPYLSRLSEELHDLTRLSEELQERNSFLASLNNNATDTATLPPSLLIHDPLKTLYDDPFLSPSAVELNSNTVVIDLSEHIEEQEVTPEPEPEPDANLGISSESTEDLSNASDVVLDCNSCSRQTSDDITEDLETCVEVLGKGDTDDLQEEVADESLEEVTQEACNESSAEEDTTVQAAAEETVPTPTPATQGNPTQPDVEQGPLLRSVAGSAVSLRPGYSMESSDAGDMSEQTATSGSDCSRRDTNSAGKTASTASLGPNSMESSDAGTGSGSDCSRDLRYADRRAVRCDGRSSSEEAPPRGVTLVRQKAAVQEPPEALTKTESCASSLSGSTSQESLPSDNGGGAITFHRYYHVFREGELDQLIERYVENLHIISSYYDHANWCVVAEKVHVWTI
ncbi:hypothetical protein ANN_03611, partial [Periplaneta americana]